MNRYSDGMPAVLPLLLLTSSPGISSAGQVDLPVFRAPAGDRPTKIVYEGETVLPNGRLATPLGERIYTGDDLWNVVLNSNGNIAACFHDGGFTAFSGLRTGARTKKTVSLKKFAPCGRFSPKSTELIVSTGDEGTLVVYDTAAYEPMKTIPINEGEFKDSYINDLVLSPDGKLVYGVDIARQELVTVDLGLGKVTHRQKAGREPYAIAINEDGSRLYVANIGIFDYSISVGEPGNKRGLTKPPFGYPSPEAEMGVKMEGKTVPGLGSPFVPDAQSIYQYDVKQGMPSLGKTVKSGILIHAPADAGKSVGGSAPNALLARNGRLYVSNANNDTVQVFDGQTLKLKSTFKLTVHPSLAKLRGVIPSGLALSGDGKRLYVCESGLNAVAVLNAETGKLIGQIPTGWFPTTVRLDEVSAKVYISTQKGLGQGPQGPLSPRKTGDERIGYGGMPGMLQIAKIPSDRELSLGAVRVAENNGTAPLKEAGPKWPKEITHVVFITKENHTFDGIFGGLKGANGEPTYAEFGMQGWIKEKGTAEKVPIMPNHIRLAEQFGISDNFYMEPRGSGDGHRWLVGVYPSLWTTRVYYSGWEFRGNKSAPGRFTSFSANGSQIPEDYLENGSLWEHLDRAGITFRNYGEGFEFPGADEDPAEQRSGVFEVANYPMPAALFKNTCFEYPIFNTNIPDIARYDWFLDDVKKNFRGQQKPLPKFMNITLCNDHGEDPRPKWGYPYVCSYMADNDLALGKTVDWLSHQPEWKHMAIFVTQDDSGADNDHVDRHRSFVLCISPYAKRGFVSKRHTSIMSIIRSIYGLFGLGPNNLFDALATPLDDMFTDKPDFTPYTHVMSDPRVFKPSETMDPADPQFKKRRILPTVRMDDPRWIERLRRSGR